MSESDSTDITVHLSFRSDGAVRPPISVRAVHDWLKHDADVAAFARRHDAQARVVISGGRAREVIDFDGTSDDERTMIGEPP